MAATIVVIAGVSWLGLKQRKPHRSQIACKERGEALERQLGSIKQDAQERLKIGAKKAEVSWFFAEHGMPFDISKSEAFGTL